VNETKIFDPADGFAPFANVVEITDASVVKRGNRWWMYTAGGITGLPGIQLSSASLPEGAPLSATGWKLTADPTDLTKIAPLAGQEHSQAWDLQGGRHCPSYVRGWDPQRHIWVERIYYAGGAEFVWGPYTIGYLEWDGKQWVDQPAPAFVATESWEHGSVYEPNLVYHDGKWKMWYVAGSNQEDYIVQGYAESDDGRSHWSDHKTFTPAAEKIFDFRVFEAQGCYEAVFSRVWLGKGAPPSQTGLWWCHADRPSCNIADWSEPVQIMTAEDRGWHTGPWKPSPQYSDIDPNRLFVFFDGIYRRPGDDSPFPFEFTLGCLEIDRPSLFALSQSSQQTV